MVLVLSLLSLAISSLYKEGRKGSFSFNLSYSWTTSECKIILHIPYSSKPDFSDLV